MGISKNVFYTMTYTVTQHKWSGSYLFGDSPSRALSRGQKMTSNPKSRLTSRQRPGAVNPNQKINKTLKSKMNRTPKSKNE